MEKTDLNDIGLQHPAKMHLIYYKMTLNEMNHSIEICKQKVATMTHVKKAFVVNYQKTIKISFI